ACSNCPTWMYEKSVPVAGFMLLFFFFFQAEDGIRVYKVTGVQTCALPILGWLPEHRYMHAVRLGGAWYGNVHAQARVEQARLAAATLRRWAGETPAVLGGDFNLRSFSLDGFDGRSEERRVGKECGAGCWRW